MISFQDIKIGPKLIAAFLVIGLVPFAIIGLISLNSSSNALHQASFNQLEAVRAIKKAQIESFFAERQGDMGVLIETVGTMRTTAFSKLEAIQVIKANQITNYFKGIEGQINILSGQDSMAAALSDFEGAFDNGGLEGTTWKNMDKSHGPDLVDLMNAAGYYDVFLISSSGNIVYSAAKESDLGENLLSGPLKDSGLAEAFRNAKGGNIGFSDFEPYAPSNMAPASFIAQEISLYGSTIGAIAIQIPLGQVNDIMQERTGLGKTGETYLVGSDKLMRSDSFLDPKNHSVEASFANPDLGSVDTEAVRLTLEGKPGQKIIIDYNGNSVLSVFSPLELYGKTWVIIAEIDAAEAFVPVNMEGKEFYKKYVDMYGYYDLFLINPDGYAFYTAFREPDYQTNLISGKYKDSNLGELVRHVKETGEYGVADFRPYAPSNGAPAAFIAEPVVHNGEIELIVGLQLSLDAINGIMQQREGMGESGESYLVGQDLLMRSDSFLDQTNHTVVASFANPDKGSVTSVSAKKAIAGETGSEIVIDYNGNPVLSAYTNVKVGDSSWGLLTEIDESEAFAVVDSMQMMFLIIAIIGILVILAVGYLLSRSISVPVLGMTDAMEKLADKDMTVEVPSTGRGDEIGNMAGAVQVFKDNMIRADELAEAQRSAELVEQQRGEARAQLSTEFDAQVSTLLATVSSSATEMENTAHSLSATAEQTTNQAATVAAASEEASVNVQTVSSAAEELSSSITEISRQVGQSSEITKKAVIDANATDEQIQGLATAADRIGDVVALITDIADQTNLLALNATIEAARAGDAGKGFAVVASEVKNLANQTAKATEEISGQISDIQTATRASVEAIQGIGKIIQEVDEIAVAISSAVEEQGAATQEIARNVEQASEGTNEVNVNIAGVSEAASDTGAASSQVMEASRTLNTETENLKNAVETFLTDMKAI